MNTETIIKAITKQSRQVEFLHERLKAEYRYYGTTLNQLSIKDIEYLVVLGGYLAIEQILKSVSDEHCDLSFERYHFNDNSLEGVNEALAKHFSKTLKDKEEPEKLTYREAQP
jgi:hypothetical protein